MRALIALVLFFGACRESPPGPNVSSAPTAAAPSSISVPEAVGSTGAPAGPPLFTYEEGSDVLSYWPPTTLRLVRSADGGARTCMSELSTGKDNMWTGPDVEAAFRSADVQAVLRGGTVSFWPDLDDSGAYVEGTLRSGKGTIEWKVRPCHWCVAPSKGVQQLRRVLAGVMMNRRLLCP